MRRFLGVGFVVVVIFGFVMVAAAEDPRQATGPIDRAEPTYVPSTEAILIDEGFEVAVPPPLWSWQGTHAGDTTWHQGLSPASGTYNANCLYDPALVPQDEWIVSEAYDLASGVLSFWSMGSLYWCRDDFDNCDLEIWLVVGGIGGGDDILLGTADVDWAVSYTYVQSTFVLDTFLPLNAAIGFRYVGLDGAQIGLDDVLLDGVLVPVELQSIDIE